MRLCILTSLISFLVCVLFGTPFLHLLSFLMIFLSCLLFVHVLNFPTFWEFKIIPINFVTSNNVEVTVNTCKCTDVLTVITTKDQSGDSYL